MSTLSATVAVCTYNRYDHLPKCVESLTRQTLDPARFDVVVVDNSPDATRAAEAGVAMQAIGGPRLTYLLEKTPGLSNARNVAACASSADVIAFIDDDAIAEPDWLERIVDAFESFGDKAGVVGGRIDPIWESARPNWLSDRMLGQVSVVDWGGSLRVAGPDEWFAGANIAYRRALLQKVGGFAVNLGRIGGSGASLLSNEESAVNDAAVAAGLRLIYAPDARVSHLVDSRRLTREWFRQRIAWQAVSDLLARPETTLRDPARHWRSVIDFLDTLPPSERQLSGLHVDTEDPDLFQRQLGAVYGMTVTALTGFREVNAPAPGDRR